MKTFRFRAARILEWRRVQLDAARVAFVRATESVREAAQGVADADAACDASARDYVGVMAEPVDVGTISRHRNWIDRQRGHAMACRRIHEARRIGADQAANALHEAARHVKVMEKLRDRAWRRHLDLERQEEMKTLDQLATSQFARRRAEEGVDGGY